MAESTLCINCATLPIKDREVATRIRRCPECKAEIGVTSYGANFRARPGKRAQLLTPSIFLGVCGGATALLTFGACLFMFILRTSEPQRPREKPMAAVKPIAPVMPAMPLPDPGLLVDIEVGPVELPPPAPNPAVPPELLDVPEVALEDPFGRVDPQQAAKDQRDLIGQIRRENAAKPDGFLLAQMDRRKELRGLPFIMGEDCKLGMAKGQAFAMSVGNVRRELDRLKQHDPALGHLAAPWVHDPREGSRIAAMAQILGPEAAHLRRDMVNHLTASRNPRAGDILVDLAIFDPAEEVRNAAVAALTRPDKKQYTTDLMRGMRYPMPGVAKRAADAMIALDRKHMLPHLVAFLGEAAPGDPVLKRIDNKNVHVVREVVRINHHRNCLLCHAPVDKAKPWEVAALMPTPGQPIPQSSQQYYGSNITPQSLAVRADITYLRQDFSVVMPVADAHPWPEKQRFDFLVRTRVVEGDELAQLQKTMAERPAAYMSEQHKEALRVLRQLSGQDAAQTQAEWRRVLGLDQP